MIKLTNADIKEIQYDQHDLYDLVFDDIPFNHPDNEPEKGETHRDYIEDDGREYRWLTFTDKAGKEYHFNYIYEPDFSFNYKTSLFDINETKDAGIEWVDKHEEDVSEIVEKEEPKKELTEDEILWSKYNSIKIDCKEIPLTGRSGVPKAILDDVLTFVKTQQFSMIQLRAKIIPICIEHKWEVESFFKLIQKKAYSKK